MIRKLFSFVSNGNFLARASIVELAAGFVVIGALQSVISKLITDLIMPVFGALFGGFWFPDYFLALHGSVTATELAEAQKQGAVFAYGDFVITLFSFIVILLVSFLALRIANKVFVDKVTLDPK
jgi:large conductance mechanosensitive channel